MQRGPIPAVMSLQRPAASSFSLALLPKFRRCRPPIVANVTKHGTDRLTNTVERYYVEVLNKKNLAALDEVASPDVVYSDRCWSTHDLVGLKRLRAVHDKLLTAYPDYSVHLDSTLARDDSSTVMVHWTAKGTCSDNYHGLPASGKRSVVSGCTVFLFGDDEGGKISEIITYRQANQEEREQYLGIRDV